MITESKSPGVASIAVGTVTPSDWLYSSDGAQLGCKPFLVGTAKIKIYGCIPPMATRCNFFASIAEDISGLKAISEQNPYPLLADYQHFDEGKILPSFRVVWNYINGMYPEFTRLNDERSREDQPAEPTWPSEINTILEKYRVLYFANYFGIPLLTDDRFMTKYVDLFANDLAKEFKAATQETLPSLLTMARGMRSLIYQTSVKYGEALELIGAAMPQEFRYDFIYGLRDPQIPANYWEIYPSDQGIFSYDQLKEAKGLVAQMYDYDESKGIREIKTAELLPVEQVRQLRELSGSDAGAFDAFSNVLVLRTATSMLIQPTVYTSNYYLGKWLAPELKQPQFYSSPRVKLRLFSANKPSRAADPALEKPIVVPSQRFL